MELRQLKHFVAVGEAGSITAAAKKLRLTQPALSRQIKALEEELDTALLERGAHSKRKTITPKELGGQKLLLYDREHYPDYWDRITGFFRDHELQAKVAGEFDGVSSLTAALEGNLGIAILSKSSEFDRSRRQRLISRPLTKQPVPIEVAAGISTAAPASSQLLAFIEELKHAAGET